MIYEMMAQIRVEESLRQTGRYRLIYQAKRPRQTRKRPRLAKLTGRFGLNRTGRCEGNSDFRQDPEVKDCSLVYPHELSATVRIEPAPGRSKVALIRIRGCLNARNYQELIRAARQALEAGYQNLVLDMSKMISMSSSGLIALHSVALLMRGEEPSDPEFGWEAFRALARDRDSGMQERVKLLTPQPNIGRSLEITGMKDRFEFHTDLDTAIASFN